MTAKLFGKALGLAVGLVAATVTAPVVTASAAPVPVEVQVGIAALPGWCTRGELWDEDGRTVGARCDVTFAYYAKVTCTNGSTRKTARGVTTNDDRWSYAYCTSYGSSYRVVAGTGGPVRG